MRSGEQLHRLVHSHCKSDNSQAIHRRGIFSNIQFSRSMSLRHSRSEAERNLLQWTTQMQPCPKIQRNSSRGRLDGECWPCTVRLWQGNKTSELPFTRQVPIRFICHHTETLMTLQLREPLPYQSKRCRSGQSSPTSTLYTPTIML